MPKNTKSNKSDNTNKNIKGSELEMTDLSETNMSNNLDNILQQLASGLLQLQVTVGNLASNVEQNKSFSRENLVNTNVNDRAYIVNWRELGGLSLIFYPNGKIHPMSFLKKLNKMLDDAGVPEERKIGMAIGCLRGTAADWAAVKERQFKKFSDFEMAFKNRYWGVEKQRDLFLDIKYGQFEKDDRAEYFLNLLNQASFLDEQIPEDKLIESLTKHFPVEVQRGIITSGLSTVDDVEGYLRKIDETYNNNRDRGDNHYTRNNTHSQGNYNRNNPGVNRENNRNETNRRDEVRGGGRSDNNRFSRNNENSQNREEQNNVNFITEFNVEPDFLLSEPEEEIEVVKEKEATLPLIRAVIGQQKIDLVIDSGSEISVISEVFYNVVKNDLQSLPILPVTNVAIKVAVGDKPQRVKRQILLPITIGNVTCDMECLVVSGLNRKLLLGYDWIRKCKAVLDSERQDQIRI